MSRSVYDDGDQWQVIPKWKLVERWSTGHGIYEHRDADRSQWLYRYMRADQAVRMLTSRTIWFAAPHKWQDPHEKWWCEQLFRPGSHLATAYAYGSCWTRRWRDEPFWRLYTCECGQKDRTKKKVDERALPAVRFRARATVLFDWLRNAARRETCKVFMGRVTYCPVDQLRHMATKARSVADNVASAAATGLHLKRRAYQFEEEVRMLWIDQQPKSDGRAIPFDPIALFDQVMIGPTLPEDIAHYSEVEAMLMDLGIPLSLIEPSSIWKTP